MMILLTACSSISRQELEVVSIETPRPTLVLPTVDKFQSKNVEWVVVTPENIEDIFSRLEDSNDNVVLFAVTARGYENLSLNMAELTKLIKQQQSIIAAYEQYYEEEQ